MALKFVVGEEEITTVRRLSTAPAQIASFPPYSVAPPPKPPRTDRAVLSSLKKRKEREIAAAATATSDAAQNTREQKELPSQIPIQKLTLEEATNMQKQEQIGDKVSLLKI